MWSSFRVAFMQRIRCLFTRTNALALARVGHDVHVAPVGPNNNKPVSLKNTLSKQHSLIDSYLLQQTQLV